MCNTVVSLAGGGNLEKQGLVEGWVTRDKYLTSVPGLFSPALCLLATMRGVASSMFLPAPAAIMLCLALGHTRRANDLGQKPQQNRILPAISFLSF